MDITGLFPDFSAMTTASATEARRLVSDPSYREIVDSSVMLNAVRPKVLAAAGRDASIYLPSDRVTHFGPFNCVTSGEPLPPPPSRYIELFERKSHNNGKRWKARHRTNDIIVSPYAVGVAEFTYQLGRTEEFISGPIMRQKDLNQSGLFPLYDKNKMWIIVDGWIYEGNRILYPAVRQKVSESIFRDDPTGMIASRLTGAIGSELKGALVAECLAEANRGTIDALTAMAEFPATLRSIMDGVKLCMKIYKDARIKSFRLYNKAKRQQGVNQSQADLAKNAKELADAIANVWLNFRYNIMPNVYTIEDAIKTLETDLKEFVRFRETQNVQQHIDFNSQTWLNDSQSFNVTHRVLIKRLLELSSEFPKIKHLVLTNVAVTGYELVPFSFVFDWFVNMGDMIAAFSISPEFTQQGATYSWKYTGAAHFTHVTDKSGVSVNLKAYKCDVINPLDSACLEFNPDLDWMRKTDALALTWSVFKKEISSSLARALRT